MRQLAISMNLLIILLLLATCGATQREKTIKATLVTVNAARDAFLVHDKLLQEAIVEAAPTHEEGSRMLAEHRKKREPLVEAFAAVYRAIATAATANDDPSITTMLDAAKQLAELVDAFKRILKPEPKLMAPGTVPR